MECPRKCPRKCPRNVRYAGCLTWSGCQNHRGGNEDIVKRCDSILTEDLKEIKDRFYDVVGKLGIAREI